MIMSGKHVLWGASLATLAVVAAAPAQAQQARVFAIPAGALDTALTLFAEQGDQQILFTSAQVRGRETGGVSGRYTAAEALDRLLAGTGLGWTETRPGVIALRRAETAEVSPSELDEVIVTGSLLRGPALSPSPVTVVRRDEIDATGRGTVADALVALPQNYAGSATPTSALVGSDPMQSNTGFSTGVNLRGLGPDSTLVLVNGRRLAGTGSRGDFSDVSALPTSVVERVDILLDGASAIYQP